MPTLTKVPNVAEQIRAKTQFVKDNEGQILWEAYCPTCGKCLEAAPNGSYIEAVARRHTWETRHAVLLGMRTISTLL